MLAMQRILKTPPIRLSVAMWLLLVLVATGCIPQHHHFTHTWTGELVLRCVNPEQYSIRVPHNGDYPVPPNGHITLNFRVTDGYWEARFMDANFAGSMCNTRDVKAIYIVRGGAVVKKIGLNQLWKCPADEHGYNVIELDRE
jgi:hypothetical protein